jgi:glutamate/tyrosine decarboxylase-like PLP-dependent enzyme
VMVGATSWASDGHKLGWSRVMVGATSWASDGHKLGWSRVMVGAKGRKGHKLG